MNKLFKYRASKVLVLLAMFMVSTVGASLFFAKSASADWFDDLSADYIVYKKPDSSPTSFLYYSGKDSSWKFLQAPNIPKVHLDGKSCDTADANINFDSSKTYNNCTGLIITPNTQPDWFKEANLVFKIGDYDSDENIEVTGGRVTKVGSKTDANITSGGKKSQAKAHDGCSGGNPNKTDSCSALLVFNYSYGESFKITIDNQWNGSGKAGSSGHEYYYDAPAMENYRTLTFNPNGGTIPAGQLDRHYTVTLWEHPGSGSNLLREYKKSAKVGYYPVPQRAGYTFNGWYDGTTNRFNGGDAEANGRFNLTNDTTLVANWTASSYTITYNANGGSGTLSGNPFTQNSGTSHSVRSNSFTRTGYEFVRWCTAANGTGTCYTPGNTFTVTGNVTLYAQWDTWTITAYTYSAVNHANPMSNVIDTSSNALYNNNRKSAYPSYPAFGGHAAGAEDKVYYMIRVNRSSDAVPGAAAFKYVPTHAFGYGLIATNSVNTGQADVSALCPTGFSYDSSFKRCNKGGSWTDASLNSGASGYYTLTTTDRLWNNAIPANSLNNLKGMDLCYIMSFNRQSLSSPGGNDTTSEYWGSLDGSLENRCSVTVRTPWILEPRVTNSRGIGTQNAAVGDTFTITPSIGSSQTNVDGTSHNVSIVQVIGSGTWNPVQGITANLNVAPTAANIGSFGSGAASISTLSTVNGLTDTHFASGTWSGSAFSQTFQDAWYGRKVCYYTVITSGGWAFDRTTEYRYSNPVCVKWAKSPQIQLRGSDSSSGGVWEGTSTSYDGGFLGVSQSDTGRGSWSQYGLLGYKGANAATGNINHFGSGGWTTDNGTRARACNLTFANIINSVNCSSNAIGGGMYNGSSLTQTISLPTNAKIDATAINALAATPTAAGAGTAASPLILNTVPSGTYKLNAGSHIGASQIPSGRQITIVSAGDIYLDGDIVTAATTFGSLSDVPILTVISRGQIIVGTSVVNQLFGTYIVASDSATKGFKTCHVDANDSRMRDGGDCNRQLRVNGAVITRPSPMLRRTLGSGYSSSSTNTLTANGETHLEAITPSELFNYQPNLFLTPYAIRQSSTTGNTWIVTKQTVLPARF